MLSIQIYEAGEVNGLRLRLQLWVNCSIRGPDLEALAAAPDAASVLIPLTRKFLYGLGLYLADRGSEEECPDWECHEERVWCQLAWLSIGLYCIGIVCLGTVTQ